MARDQRFNVHAPRTRTGVVRWPICAAQPQQWPETGGAPSIPMAQLPEGDQTAGQDEEAGGQGESGIYRLSARVGRRYECFAALCWRVTGCGRGRFELD